MVFITDLKDLGFRVLLTDNFLLGKFKEISETLSGENEALVLKA